MIDYSFPGLRQIWSVSEITGLVQEILEGEELLQDVWVGGEISNLSRPASGHVYFTLKDAGAALRCVMWKSNALRLNFDLRDGDAIDAHGSIRVYPPSGQYQLVTDGLRPTGEGFLYQEFLRLKARLEAEGLFAAERKRPLPPFPARIGIVTSPSGAAIRDVLNTIRRRFPLAQVTLAPAAVQGEAAPAEIVAALMALNELVKPDVIILGRGGGSIEDLWAFNDENVARAIYSSQAPVITGIGHETDFTIADFTADVRAATPTAAAELATPNVADLREELHSALQKLKGAATDQIHARRLPAMMLRSDLERNSPLSRIHNLQQRTQTLKEGLARLAIHSLEKERLRWAGYSTRLEGLNPMSVLGRGYAIVTRQDGQIVRRTNDVQENEDVGVRLTDGELQARILKKSAAMGGEYPAQGSH
jgi:exodeoxyribonuclease VII large subunit